MLLRFSEWLSIVEGRAEVPAGVLQGYEHAFKDQLRQVIQRTQNPALRARLVEMLDCPIVDSRGQCRSFSDYIVSALIKNGIHYRYDIESALSYVVEKMLMPTTDAGEPRMTVFGGFQERPGDSPDFNPLQVRFLKYLQFAVNNIRRGKIPRLAATAYHPQGTLSIGQGRRRDGDSGGVWPDEVAAPESGEADLGEMIQDIEGLLRRKESEAGFPLVSLFRAIMGGMPLEQQRRRFGDRRVRWARQMIVDTLKEYAEASGNATLLHLLARMTGEAPTQPRRTAVPAAQPVLSDQERDYASIAQVVARFDRPVGTADLGRFRRRWLEYPPRDPASGHRNRLEEVLAAMVRDGVLKAVPTRTGATVYGRGPRFEEFHREEVGVG